MDSFFVIFFIFPFMIFILTYSLEIYIPRLQTLFAFIQVILGLYGFIILTLIVIMLATSLIGGSISNT